MPTIRFPPAGDAPPDGRHEGFDTPSAADRRRVRKARADALAKVREIDDAYAAAMREAFRQEIGAGVRSVSPFLIALLATEGLTVDDMVALIEPQPAWPRRPRLSGGGSSGRKFQQHYVRHYAAGRRFRDMSQPPLHGHEIDLAGGGWLKVQIADHSIELHGRIGGAFLTTRFGELRVELIDEIPDALLLACIGRPIGSVVDHDALRNTDWSITEVEDATATDIGQVLVVPTGSVSYRMPWVRR